MILTPLIDIDNLDPTNGIIYIFEPLWSLMTNGERIVYKDNKRGRISHRRRDMTKEKDQLKSGSIKILSTQVGGAGS